MPLKLTHAERLILSNQFQILALLDPDGAAEYRVSQEIVDSGYEHLYGGISNNVYNETTPVEVGEEVVAILDMFRNLEFSCRKLKLDPAAMNVDFEGFDANESTGHYGYAHFRRRTQNLWNELKGYPDNSHSGATLPRYQSMLSRYRKIGKHIDLTEDEIKTIAGR